MGSDGVINDKDLRRKQIRWLRQLFDSAGGRHSKFGEHAIHMQVGDNIEDFEGILQHDVDDWLLESTEGDLVYCSIQCMAPGDRLWRLRASYNKT